MSLRALLVVMVALFATATAHAQAPAPSFFEGRTLDELRELASDPRNDVLLRRGAATKLVMALADLGDFDEADAAGREFGKNIDARAIAYSIAGRRRHRIHVAALGALVVTLGVAMLSIFLRRRMWAGAVAPLRRLTPALVAFFSYAGLMGGYLASRYENGTPLPFLLFAVLMLPLVMTFRIWSVLGSPAPAARTGRGVAAVTATLALGFLVVEYVDKRFLEGFGL